MTSTDLANLALGNLGIPTIDDIESTTSEEAKACNLVYDDVRKIYLAEATPGFSRADVALAIAADEESEVYDYVYTYPADCIKTREIWNEGATPRIEYEVGSHSSGTSKVIVTNQEDAILVYTRDITNLNMFTSHDIDALSYLFSAKIVMKLKRNEQLETKMAQRYLITLAIAQKNNKREQHKALAKLNNFTSSRV
jgi:hypothetical protein